MPNHYHLLLHERALGGVSKFMQRVGVAYTLSFNDRWKWSGVLFQGKYKSRLITDETYLAHLVNYIHLNPKDLAPMHTQKEFAKLWDFLLLYAWSSITSMTGSTQWQEVINILPLKEAGVLPSPSDYMEFLKESWKGGPSDPMLRTYIFD